MSRRLDKHGTIELPQPIFRSDDFKGLYDLMQLVPGLAHRQNIIRIQLVIDANIVLAEIRCRLIRRTAVARSNLQEAIDSGIVIAIAPRFLASEIDDEHLSRVLKGTGKTVVDAKREWEDFRSKIHFYQPFSEGDPALRKVDPDDVDYALTCEETGADAIYSRDKHLRKMGARVVAQTPDRILRDYARSGAVVMGVTASSGFLITVSCSTVWGGWKLIEKALEGFCSLPIWTKLLIAGCVIAMVTRPGFREGVTQRWRDLCSTFEFLTPGFLDVVSQFSVAYVEAEKTTIQSKAELQSILPPQTPKTILQHARSVCIRNEEPLPLYEIIRRMEAEGYHNTSNTPRADLSEALHGSGQFVESEKGEWLMVKPDIGNAAIGFERLATQVRTRASRPRRGSKVRRGIRRRPHMGVLKIEPQSIG